jgi:hypothetical protein
VATTTPADLTQDLQWRLKAAGMDRGMAIAVTDLLPPAGQHDLCTELRDNPDALRELGHTWPGALADRFRTSFIAADEIRAQLLAVAR